MATWTAAFMDTLPDSCFAYVEPGGKKDSEGKTTPRSLRHLPYKDASGKVDMPHLRNALSRLPQTDLSPGAQAQAKKRLEAAAAAEGVGSGKSAIEVKAEPMSTAQLDRWLGGKTSRRILVVPFGGPIPQKGAPLGVDLDGEWFDDDTDLFGPYAALRATRERMVDWHHDTDPTGRMKGAILGHIVLDDEAESDGYWADFWANAGEKRRALVAALERHGIPLYGSSQAVYKKATKGHIDEWPLYRHTITTSPQNTLAVVPPLKALLMADLPIEEIGYAALKAALLGLDAIGSELLPSYPDAAVQAAALAREADVKAGRVLSAKNEAAMRTRLHELIGLIDEMVASAQATVQEIRPNE